MERSPLKFTNADVRMRLGVAGFLEVNRIVKAGINISDWIRGSEKVILYEYSSMEPLITFFEDGRPVDPTQLGLRNTIHQQDGSPDE